MVAIDESRRATCDSSATVTLSRKRRCTRVLTVRRNQVAVAEMPSPSAETRTRRGRCASTPSPSSLSQTASSASGSADNSASAKATDISAGSCWYPSLHSRHIDDRAGGRSSCCRSGEDVILLALLVLRGVEPLRLQIEHRLIASAQRHQLVVGAELDDPTTLEDADAIGLPHGGEAMRDQDGRRVPGRGEDALEDLRFAADVELRCRFVEQHDGGAGLHRAQRAGQRDALPLTAGEIRAAVVAARQNRVEAGQRRRAGGGERRAQRLV